MRTCCPECGSPLDLDQPGNDPAATADCAACGGTVRPGLFRCPHCETALQVNRGLLPPGGARGRCPSCSGMVRVPGLASEAELSATARIPVAAPAAGAAPAADDPASTTRLDAAALAAQMESMGDETTQRFSPDDIPAISEEPAVEEPASIPPDVPAPEPGEDEGAATRRFSADAIAGEAVPDEDEGATRRLDVAEIQAEIAAQQTAPAEEPPAAEPSPEAAAPPAAPRAAPRIETPKPVAKPRPTTRPRTSSAAIPRPKPRRGKGGPILLGLLLGGSLAGAGGYAASSTGLWSFPPFPVEGLGVPELVSWVALLAVAGALVGALLAGLFAGRR